MTASVDEIRRLFGPFAGDTLNLQSFDAIYPGKLAPVLRRQDQGGITLELMEWGFPGPAAAKGRPVTNVRNLQSSFWRSTLDGQSADASCQLRAFVSGPPSLTPTPCARGRSGSDGLTTLSRCLPSPVSGVRARVDVPRWLDDERVSACELAVPVKDEDTAVLA